MLSAKLVLKQEEEGEEEEGKQDEEVEDQNGEMKRSRHWRSMR